MEGLGAQLKARYSTCCACCDIALCEVCQSSVRGVLLGSVRGALLEVFLCYYYKMICLRFL